MNENSDGLDISRVLPALPPTTGLLRVAARNNPVCTICSPAFWVVKCHWVKGHSYAHLRDKGKCVGCDRQWPLKVRCLLLVTHGPKGKEEFLDLTAESSHELLDIAPLPDNLRGLQVSCGRVGLTTRGRITFAVLGMANDLSRLPQDKSPEASCLRLWGQSPELYGQVDVA